jgi:hypothetical protein
MPASRAASPIGATSGRPRTVTASTAAADGQLNRALYFVSVTRQRSCPATKSYIAGRTSGQIGRRPTEWWTFEVILGVSRRV